MKNIAVISTCKYQLLEREYVDPLKRILNTNKVYRLLEIENEPEEDIIVISGTALKDFDYFLYIDKLGWIKNTKKLVIGICAGAQLIAKLFEIGLINKAVIGVKNILWNDKIRRAYFLTTKIPEESDKIEILSKTNDGVPAIFKIKNLNIYGFVFHPEVYNADILLDIIKSFDV